jgi:6-methylsalicylate decarboxylase
MKISRRTLLEVGAIGALGLAYGGKKLSDTFMMGPPPTGGRIDTHHHFMPPEFVKTIGADRLAAVTPSKTLPEWSVEKALAMCDTYGISEATLSISPGYPALEAAIERPLMRVCNDIGATIRRDHPGKFGQFASIPMFDRAEALKEIEYAFDTLKADGIVVFTNYGGTYLGDPSFDEIWQELNRRKAVVFIHPTHPTYELKGQPPESVIEYPFETVRAATSLMFSGATRKFADIKFILSHAGGALPYLAARISGGAMFNPDVSKRVPDVMAEIRKFWFDLALSSNPAALSALLTVADHKRIVFGSDFPYAPDIGIRVNVAASDRYPMDDHVRADIGRGNALALLGRASA